MLFSPLNCEIFILLLARRHCYLIIGNFELRQIIATQGFELKIAEFQARPRSKVVSTKG